MLVLCVDSAESPITLTGKVKPNYCDNGIISEKIGRKCLIINNNNNKNSSVKVNIFNIKLLQNQYILMGEKWEEVCMGK